MAVSSIGTLLMSKISLYLRLYFLLFFEKDRLLSPFVDVDKVIDLSKVFHSIFEFDPSYSKFYSRAPILKEQMKKKDSNSQVFIFKLIKIEILGTY